MENNSTKEPQPPTTPVTPTENPATTPLTTSEPPSQTKKPWYTHIWGLLTIAGAAIPVYVFLTAFWYRPRLDVFAGAVDLVIPAQVQLELMSYKMFFQPLQTQESINDSFFAELKKLGLPAEKIDKIKATRRINKDGVPSMSVSPPNAHFSPDEDRLVALGIFRAMQNMTREIIPKLPTHVAFFTIKNSGHSEAESVRITIAAPGQILDVRTFSENSVQSTKTTQTCTIDCPMLTPNSRISGMIWLTGEKTDLGSLAVAFRNGETTTQEFRSSLFIDASK